ncbi:hypothetical protein Tco_0455727 [Tanacetum coccineum]
MDFHELVLANDFWSNGSRNGVFVLASSSLTFVGVVGYNVVKYSSYKGLNSKSNSYSDGSVVSARGTTFELALKLKVHCRGASKDVKVFKSWFPVINDVIWCRFVSGDDERSVLGVTRVLISLNHSLFVFVVFAILRSSVLTNMLMTCIRPDIAFVVGKLSSLTYTVYPSVLEGYTDARWISNTKYNLFTNGCVFLLSGGAISWASKKKTCITSSTMESEIVALAAAGKEAEWLRNLILEIPLWSKPITPISIRCDSAATLTKAYS